MRLYGVVYYLCELSLVLCYSNALTYLKHMISTKPTGNNLDIFRVEGTALRVNISL